MLFYYYAYFKEVTGLNVHNPREQKNTTPAEDWGWLKEEIKSAASGLGIDQVGFTTADPFLSLKPILEEIRAKGYESGFEEKDIDKRVDPKLTMAEARSIIAVAVAYPSKMVNPPKSEPGRTRGILARSAWGRDYHTVLREAMDKLAAFIKERVPDVRIESMVDTGVLNDRAVAERAGIGFAGKNGLIISPDWGSWIYLGEMITDLPFEPDPPVLEDCGECTKCLDACPTGALLGGGMLNAQRCVSFLTQTKGFLSEEFMLKIGNRLYGCDTCQMVCPKNRGKHWDHRLELQPDPEIAKPLLQPLLDISNRDFKDRFGPTAAAWRGKKPIQRNAVIALGNFKDRAALPKLMEVLLHDPRPELRGTAAWAISRIGGEEALEAINQALEKECDEMVLTYIREAEAKLREAAERELTEQSMDQPAGQRTEELTREAGGALFYEEMSSPIGLLTVAGSAAGICLIQFGGAEATGESRQKWAAKYMPGVSLVRSSAELKECLEQLGDYFAGRRTAFDLKLDLKGTPFQLKVWEALLQVPYGQTASYKTIAEQIGQPKAVRAVGGANNRNPVPVIVPCHRIVGANGAMTGYAGGIGVKESLLAIERQRN
ncbi:tRNA epoxyqueuosine(34) reductase QueG [Paenibacillus pinistramenti]|uniref:tRNA epoxyqueuosine(34) reductase QueG n=1 Tax=Paenibacillus pinistramenti TaxID=1768003 RepID=UPI001109CA71|nr:tRNA epoxyqueuosine(34) reductase QueG [Paenibacillus pinistramenti]